MNDAAAIISDHTKKYNIPVNHLDRVYIQQCTDGPELEQIYKELVSGEVGPFPLLEELALERIRDVQPNSEILRQDHSPLDTLAPLGDQQTDISPIPVINNDNQQTVPKSDVDWDQHAQSVSREFDSDEDDEQPEDDSYETNKRRHTARQYRLNANAAFQSKHYQQAIDLYTESLAFDDNIVAYFNRAIAYFKLDDLDGSIRDCFQILSMDPKHRHALFQRALCYYAKEQYDDARRDLNDLITNDPDNCQVQDLLNKILTVEQTEDSLTAGGLDEVDIETSLPVSPDIIDESAHGRTIRPANVTIPNDQDIHYDVDSHTSSPPAYHTHSFEQFQISSPQNDEDDDEVMALGDEAASALLPNISDDDERVSPDNNVSPTMDDDSDVPELITHKPLQTPPATPLLTKLSPLEHTLKYTMGDSSKRNPLTTISYNHTNDDHNDLYDNYHMPTLSNHFSASKQQTHPYASRMSSYETPMQPTTIHDAISNSNFGSLIQSWLRDLAIVQFAHRSLSIHDRLWSKSARPWSLNSIQYDIDRFIRVDDYHNVIAVSKKLLQNGVLDYHYHAEYIVDTLVACSECCLKLHDYVSAIQYSTEALEYDKTSAEALICRAQAFEKENLLLFSYADYARVPADSFNYYSTQRTYEKLASKLNLAEENNAWRERVPSDHNDDERYWIYLKRTDPSFEWCQTHADKFCLDACFVLAIRCYTSCIELQPENTSAYLQRALCYLKVFEPQKAMADCDMVLKEDPNNILALYRKALAYKIARDDRSYESMLREYLRVQPNNQIVLAEYYTSRHEKIPRTKRRIRAVSPAPSATAPSKLSYEQLEQLRSDELPLNPFFDFENLTDLREQCSVVLHSLHSVELITSKSIAIVLNVIRAMIEAEQTYQLQQQTDSVPFSYIRYGFDVLLQLTTLPHIDSLLSMLNERTRMLLNEELEYYSSTFDDEEQLNRLKML